MVQALVLDELGGTFRSADVTLSKPMAQEVLVDVRASGLCHSDLTASSLGGFELPAILGHEVSGIVAAVGEGVTRLKPGDHVVASLQSHCGDCGPCRADDINMCTNPGFVRRPEGAPPRISLDGSPVTPVVELGGFAERTLVHQNNLVRIDEPIPHEIACILGCGVLTAAGAVLNASRVQKGANVAVFGCGGLGLAAIQAAVVAEADRIVGVDLAADKLELARKFGATDVVNSRDGDPVAEVKRITSGGADNVFDFTGHPDATRQAYLSVGRAGELGVIGINKPGATLTIDIGPDFIWNQVRIRPIFNGSGNFLRDIPHYVTLYNQGRFRLDDLVSRTIGLDEVNDAYAQMGAHVGRTVVTFD